MTKTNGWFAAALFGASLASAGMAHAQNPPGAAGQPPPPMQGGMCGPGGCGAGGAPAQSPPMQGMMQQQGQGGMTQGGCPMMQRSAALERRVRQLEERLGIPPAPPQPAQPGSPG